MKRSLVVHKRFTRNPFGCDWVCGDLHGQHDVLMMALDNAGFDPKIDRLFLLGDLIDRGPQSAELLGWALETDHVHSVIGNHELMFIGGATRPGYREKHRQLGGQWADELNCNRYRVLTTGCANLLPLTMTIETEGGSLGLVHAQSPVDDWHELATMDYTDQIAINCTWPWNRATGPEQEIQGITAVVSGHIGTKGIVQRSNQIWIDTLEASGKPTLMTVQDLLTLTGNKPS